MPEMNFLMVDGMGDPNTSQEYAAAVEVLFQVSYALKFMVKKGELAIDYRVMPLEGLWWAEDMSVFTAGDKSNWLWTMMIMQPEFVTREMIEKAMLVDFDQFENEAGANYFVLSPQKWIESTNAIGLVSKSGCYGGTYAHKDMSFEFASWISVEFKLYLIKEFERLKELEYKQLGWDIRRNLAKINYRIHTDAIKQKPYST